MFNHVFHQDHKCIEKEKSEEKCARYVDHFMSQIRLHW